MGYADFLRKVPLFAELPDADLNRLCSMIKEVNLASGETLFAEGDPGEEAYVIAEGEIEIVKISSGRDVLLAVRTSGDVIGETALLEMAPRSATARARGACKLLAIHKTLLDELVQGSASAARIMFFTVLARWRATGVMLRQSEKMAQLGTLTAGVAHELNNPAAAVQRGASQLADALADLLVAERALAQPLATPSFARTIDALRTAVRARADRLSDLDALTRGDREEQVEGWLDARQVTDAVELAPTLVTLDYDVDEAGAAGRRRRRRQPAGRRALARGHAPGLEPPRRGRAGRRAHLRDRQGAQGLRVPRSGARAGGGRPRGPRQHAGDPAPQAEGRDPRGAGLRARSAPHPAWGSELNQVWTNILDNASDALADRVKDGSAEITIRTRCEQDFVVVEISDNGPGIPPGIQDRIFDAFFTTKPPGKGTGLGLDISYRIVVHRHRGDLRVSSRPGDTTFTIRLPLNAAADPAKSPALNAVPPPSDAELKAILTGVHTIAVVGLSERPDRPAHQVPAFLKQHGYRVIPVNPGLTDALGEKAYPELRAVPDAIDAVLVFVRSEAVPPVVEQAIEIGARTIWMQEGIVNLEAAARARAAGLTVVMDRCMRATWQRLLAPR